MTDADHDVVVIGGGIAGLTAANRAAQLGLSVVVLEKGDAEKYLCNSRFTGGTFHVCLNDIMSGEDSLFALINKCTAGAAREDLARAVAHNAERAVRWLQGEGLKFMKISGSAYHNWVLAPPGRSRPGLDWEGRGGDVLLRTLEANLVKRNAAVLRCMRAKSLVMAKGKCIGVVAETGDEDVEFKCRAVIVADGGFQGDPELVRNYISAAPEKLRQRGAGTGIGDGLRMTSEVGAAIIGTDCFYGHLLSRDALQNDRLWPYPYLDTLANAAIVVNSEGKRFADEGRGGVFMANAVARMTDPLSAAIIFDRGIWEGPGRDGLIPANPHLPDVGGTLLTAPDLDSVAALMGVPSEALKATVAAYNDALENGHAGTVTPPRSNDRYSPMAIRTPPFYAVPVCAGITNTMGGIAIDGNSRVLRPDGGAIEGLYAAGATTGGLEGGPVVGYVGGLVRSTVSALCAADHISGSFEIYSNPSPGT